MILFPKTYTIYTANSGSFVNGHWVNGTPTTSTFIADIQPLSDKEINSLNIGRKELGKIKINTDSNLTIQDTNKTGDLIAFNGVKYEIIAQSKWEVGLIPHNEYVAEYREAI